MPDVRDVRLFVRRAFRVDDMTEDPMTIYAVTREQFNEWYATHADVLRNHAYIQFEHDPNISDDAFDALTDFFTNCTASFTDMMTANGLTITSDAVTFDSDRIDTILEAAALVQTDYEGENGRNTTMPDSPWVIYGLSGDDDVDYNGSYIDTATMLLHLFAGLPYADGYPHIPYAA